MHSVRRFALWGAVALAFGSLGLQAQEADSKFSVDWKTRFGYSASSKDNLRQSFLGFGMNLGYKVGPGKVGFELGYFYKTGDNYATTPDGSLAPAGTQALPTTLNLAKSMEDKRNELEGFTVRLSYQQDFSQIWGWQAGLQLGAKFKHQYIGDCQSLSYSGNSADAVSATSWRDNYNGTPTDSSLNPSPFAGVVWHIDKESSLEFNLLLLNYKAVEYKHYAGTASNYHGGVHVESGSSGVYVGPVANDSTGLSTFPYDKLDTKNSVVPHIEITYTFHF
jgi:hypothetical protein